MAKKKFNAYFYNTDYITLEPVRNVDPKRKIDGKILYGQISDEFIEKAMEKFPDIEFYNMNEYDKTLKKEYHLVFPLGIRKEIEKYFRENNMYVDYDKYLYVEHSIPEGYLYSGWKTGVRTKIKPEDLPESYVHVYNYKKRGYIQTAGVKDIVYKRCPFHNHAFKDDFLFISYHGKIERPLTWYNDNSDEYIFGGDIVDVIFGIEKNSPEIADMVGEIKKEMVEQYNLFVEHEYEWRRDYRKKIEKLEDIK